MNQKHLLTVLVMAVMASASLFGGFQAFRYNRSMQDSLLATDIEALAQSEDGQIRWDIEKFSCQKQTSGSVGLWAKVKSWFNGGVEASGSTNYNGDMVLCYGWEQGKYLACTEVDCTGKITHVGQW